MSLRVLQLECTKVSDVIITMTTCANDRDILIEDTIRKVIFTSRYCTFSIRRTHKSATIFSSLPHYLCIFSCFTVSSQVMTSSSFWLRHHLLLIAVATKNGFLGWTQWTGTRPFSPLPHYQLGLVQLWGFNDLYYHQHLLLFHSSVAFMTSLHADDVTIVL